MLPRLTRSGRIKAGWCIALAYLFCVLAPGLAFALGDGSRQAPCIVEDHGPGPHMHAAATDQHLHHGDHSHVSSTHASSMADAVMTAGKDAAIADKGSQKIADTRCCGLISLNAIPAIVIVLAEPPALASLCETETARSLADDAPPRHYRPPIA